MSSNGRADKGGGVATTGDIVNQLTTLANTASQQNFGFIETVTAEEEFENATTAQTLSIDFNKSSGATHVFGHLHGESQPTTCSSSCDFTFNMETNLFTYAAGLGNTNTTWVDGGSADNNHFKKGAVTLTVGASATDLIDDAGSGIYGQLAVSQTSEGVLQFSHTMVGNTTAQDFGYYIKGDTWRLPSTVEVASANSVAEDLYADYDAACPLKTKQIGPLLPSLTIEPVERRNVQAAVVAQAKPFIEGQEESFDWLGVDTQTSPSAMPERQSPNCLNVNTINSTGTLKPRQGMVRMQTKGSSQVTGVSISDLHLLSENGVRSHLLLCGDNSGGTLLDEAAYETVVVPPALPPSFKPAVTLSSSSNEIDVAISAINHLSGIENVLVKWSATAYPLSVFPDADRYSADYEEFTWAGHDAFSDSTSQSFTTSAVYFVSVWLKSGLGWSLPYRGKVTIA